MPKLGILGGTFNPIHMGHIEMAKAAKAALGLDKVLFIPGGNPPHKDSVISADLRYEMTEKSITGMNGFEVYDYEIKKNSFSYTAETLEHLAKGENELYFILGGDSLDYIEHWYHPEIIFSLAKLVVFGRDKYNCRKKADQLMEKFDVEIIYLYDEIPDISSTHIRTMCDMKLDISDVVPGAAADIINEKGLYRGYYSSLKEQVKKALKPDRFAHTEGVIKTAVKMAKIFGVDIEKAYIAALLHDSAKNIHNIQKVCEENNVMLDEFEKAHPALIHAKLGAHLARTIYGIRDEETINAIKWHTIGRIGMTDLEKIIYVADMAEEGRDFPGVDKIRTAAFSDLDTAMLTAIEQTINYNENKGIELHPVAYELREHLKMKEE